MLNIFNKVEFLKKIEKVYKISLFFPSTVSFAMNNRNNEVQAANGNININNDVNNSEINTVYNDIIDKINKNRSDDKKIKFKKFLGKGSFGEVILVEHKLGEFALKITKYTKMDRHELKALSKLNGKTCIVQNYGTIELKEDNNQEEELLIFGLEYCKYGNIMDFMVKFLKRNVMSETLVCYMAGQVVNALKNMHSIRLAYFDLKPNNILVDGGINFKLSDFSTSYEYDEKIRNYIYLGTGPYIAPEVLKGSKIGNCKNFFKPDVFSLGVMCYGLFTGAFPFLNDDNNYLDKNGEIDYLKSTKMNDINLKNLEDCKPSVIFKDFLLKCLEKDVDKRPDIFQLKKHPFIKQYEILLNEKEKLGNAGRFLSDLVAGDIKAYNDECKKYELKDDIFTLINNNVKGKNNKLKNNDLGQIFDDKIGSKKNIIKDNEYGNKGDLGQFMDDKIGSKKNIKKDIIKKNNKEKTLKKIEKGKKK